MSFGRSISTGPGRPLVAIRSASTTACATSSARSTAIECLTIGCVMPITSASWKAFVPRSVVFTWPVMNSVGDGVHLGVGDRGDEVRRARAGGADGDADPARRSGVALGGVAGGRLVAHQDVADRRVVEGVVDRQARPAGDAEDRLDPRALERADQGVGAAHLRW